MSGIGMLMNPFGNNFIVRNAYKITNDTISFLHEKLDVSPEFTKGAVVAFLVSSSYNKYVQPIFQAAAPSPVAVATAVVEQVTEQVVDNIPHYGDLKNLVVPFAISLFFDDHFVCGSIFGAGLVLVPSHYGIGASLAVVGAVCEWYYE